MAQKRSGREGNRILRGVGITSVKRKEWLTFFMIAFAIVALVAVTLLDFFLSRGMVFNRPLMVVGGTLMMIGLALRIVGACTLGRFFSLHVEIADDHELVQEGPFRYVRHPMYTGALTLGFGGAVFFGSFWGFLCFLLVFLPVFLYRIKVEERYLSKGFGKSYETYKERTDSLIPGIY